MDRYEEMLSRYKTDFVGYRMVGEEMCQFAYL